MHFLAKRHDKSWHSSKKREKMSLHNDLALNLPFERASTFNCSRLLQEDSLQRCFANDGYTIQADVPYFSVNTYSQMYGDPLPSPYDVPSFDNCLSGPHNHNGHAVCTTNVVSRRVPSCKHWKQTPLNVPLCASDGLVPTLVGCQEGDAVNGRAYAQFQCLPTVRGEKLLTSYQPYPDANKRDWRLW